MAQILIFLFSTTICKCIEVNNNLLCLILFYIEKGQPKLSMGTGFPTGSRRFHSPKTPIFLLKNNKISKIKIKFQLGAVSRTAPFLSIDSLSLILSWHTLSFVTSSDARALEDSSLFESLSSSSFSIAPVNDFPCN